MTTMNGGTAGERQEIEALLPWHAAGTLSRRDAERVERALASDMELARHYEVVREELTETIHLNESLGAPSARTMEKLFAAIDAESARAPRRRSADVAGRFAAFLTSLSPRTVAWAAGAAAIAIMVQAAALTAVAVKEHGGPMLASVESSGGPKLGVRFAAQATMAEITTFLDAYKLRLVDGPKPPRGLFTVRFTTEGMTRADANKVMHQIEAETKIVEMVIAKD